MSSKVRCINEKLTILFLIFLSISFIQPAFATTKHKTTVKHHKIVKKRAKTKHLASAQKKKQITKSSTKKHYAAKTKPSHRIHHPNTTPVVLETPKSFVKTVGQHVITFVHKTIATLRYSAYKFGGRHFDTARGVYVLDCSDYVDNILQAVYPDAYLDLKNSSRVEKPTSENYYDFFSGLPDDPQDFWRTVEDVDNLLPGDVLVFRNKNKRGTTVGHVMVVMDRPIKDSDSYFVRVADSAPSGHSEDTRSPNTSGIGVGTILLKVDPKTGQPSAYAWKTGARWKQNVKIAMARPLEMDGAG